MLRSHGTEETEAGLEIDLPLTQQDLASAVGAHREYIIKLVGQFQDQGLISLKKRHVVITDRQGLKDLVC